MSVHAQKLAVFRIRPVQHHIVRLQELTARHGFEAQPQHVAAIHGVWVWVTHLKGRDGGGDAVEALLVVGLLLLGAGEEALLVAVAVGAVGCPFELSGSQRGGFGSWRFIKRGEEGVSDGRVGEDGGAFDLECFAEVCSWFFG
jgi:hypothetical protein